jgi:hypothetical protein
MRHEVGSTRQFPDSGKVTGKPELSANTSDHLKYAEIYKCALFPVSLLG